MAQRCRVFLAGEGRSDIGDLAHDLSYRTGREGFLQPLLRRLAGDRLVLDLCGEAIRAVGRIGAAGGGRGLERKAAQALALAGHDGARALVFLVDADKTAGVSSGKDQALKRLRVLTTEIERGFERARAVNPMLGKIVTLIAIPFRMIEAWALADFEALRPLARLIPRHARLPERLWGREGDPSGNHPKRVLERCLGRSPNADDFAFLAERLDLERLEEICPVSFPPFRRAVDLAIDGCLAGDWLAGWGVHK